jgi:translocation protein SEC62
LLSDMSQADKDNIDKPKMQSLDDLLKSLDDEDENKDFRVEEDEEDKLASLLDNLVDNEEAVNDEEDE